MGRYYDNPREFALKFALPGVIGGVVFGGVAGWGLHSGDLRLASYTCVVTALIWLLIPMRPERWRRWGYPRRMRTLSRRREYVYLGLQSMSMLLMAYMFWDLPLLQGGFVLLAVAEMLGVVPLIAMYLLDFERPDAM